MAQGELKIVIFPSSSFLATGAAAGYRKSLGLPERSPLPVYP